MKLLKQGILIAALVGGLLVGLQPAAEASIDHVTLAGGCSSATLIVDYTRYSEAGDEEIMASIALGDAGGATGPDLDTAVEALPTSAPSGQVALTLNFTEQPLGTSFYVLILHIVYTGGDERIERIVGREVRSYTCGGSSNSGASNLPGCDVLVGIPEQAVAGQFIFNSEIYWAPGELVSPGLYIKAGNTYYVAGQDESEIYYKVLISCQWVWVRKDTVRPNPDPIWNNTPLPTTIVQ